MFLHSALAFILAPVIATISTLAAIAIVGTGENLDSLGYYGPIVPKRGNFDLFRRLRNYFIPVSTIVTLIIAGLAIFLVLGVQREASETRERLDRLQLELTTLRQRMDEINSTRATTEQLIAKVELNTRSLAQAVEQISAKLNSLKPTRARPRTKKRH